MTDPTYPKVAQLKTVDDLRARLQQLAVEIPVDDQLLVASNSPLAEPIMIGDFRVGNRRRSGQGPAPQRSYL